MTAQIAATPKANRYARFRTVLVIWYFLPIGKADQRLAAVADPPHEQHNHRGNITDRCITKSHSNRSPKNHGALIQQDQRDMGE